MRRNIRWRMKRKLGENKIKMEIKSLVAILGKTKIKQVLELWAIMVLEKTKISLKIGGFWSERK